MQLRALKTFEGRLGIVTGGMVFTAPDSYARALLQNKLVEEFVPSNAQLNGAGDDPHVQVPPRTANIPNVPNVAPAGPPPEPEKLHEPEDINKDGTDKAAPGNEESAPSPTDAQSPEGSPPVAGSATTSSSQRRGRPSNKRT